MQPFRPNAGATVNIDVSSSSQSVALTNAPDSIRIMNNGTATVWVNFGPSGVTAAVATGMPVGPGVTEVIRWRTSDGSALYAAAIAAGATGKIYFTPGSGI